MLSGLQTHPLSACEDFMPPVLFIPLGQTGGHVHLLHDLAPADAGVVRTEGDLALLGRVWDDALIGAADVVIEQLLEPHAGGYYEGRAVAMPFRDLLPRT